MEAESEDLASPNSHVASTTSPTVVERASHCKLSLCSHICMQNSPRRCSANECDSDSDETTFLRKASVPKKCVMLRDVTMLGWHQRGDTGPLSPMTASVVKHLNVECPASHQPASQDHSIAHCYEASTARKPSSIVMFYFNVSLKAHPALVKAEPKIREGKAGQPPQQPCQ